MKRWGLLLVVAMAGLVVAAGGQYHRNRSSENVTMTVDSSGDTAEVMKLNEFTAMDSFEYGGDIEGYGTALGEDSAYSYTSPPQIMRLTITGPVDTTAVYYCTLDCGTNVYGFEYDVPEAEADTGSAKLADVIVDSITNVAGMKDTVSGEDSVTYVLVRSKIAQNGLEGDARWTLRVSADDAGTELAKGDSTLTTLATVCDGVAAAINACDSLATKVTAANSGDSIITITSDKNGVAFTIDVADSSMDTATVTANATSKSVDTADVNIGLTYGYNSIQAKFFMGAEQHTESGLGNSDSAWLILIGVLGGDEYEIARDSANALPCSLITYLADDVGDTLLKPELLLRVVWTDTLTDTTFNVLYPIRWDVNLK